MKVFVAFGLAAAVAASTVVDGRTQPSVTSGSTGGTVGHRNKDVTGAEPDRSPMLARERFYPTDLDPNGDNWLALRSEPDGRGYRIKKMGPETRMRRIGQQGVWSRVQLDTGEIGWTLSRYLACCR